VALVRPLMSCILAGMFISLSLGSRSQMRFADDGSPHREQPQSSVFLLDQGSG
jgi:hypothetical protein